MKIYYYPDPEDSKSISPVKRDLVKISKKHPVEAEAMDFLIKQIIRGGIFIFNEKVSNNNIENMGELYALRAPKRNKKGVVRVYCSFHPYERESLILYDVEFKTTKKSSTKRAIERKKKLENFLKEAKKNEKRR